MEEKLSDEICREAFIDFYVDKEFKRSLKSSKRSYRLLMKNDRRDTKDDYYIWMMLVVIIMSYKNLNQLDKTLKYILLSLRCAGIGYKRKESYCLLIQYYISINNAVKTNYYIDESQIFNRGQD